MINLGIFLTRLGRGLTLICPLLIEYNKINKKRSSPMKQLTKEQQELINQINNDEFTEAELDAIILLSRSLISNR